MVIEIYFSENNSIEYGTAQQINCLKESLELKNRNAHLLKNCGHLAFIKGKFIK